MAPTIIPKLRRIVTGARSARVGADAAKVAMALAVLTGLAEVMDPAPARAEYAPAPAAQVRVARVATPGRIDENLARAFEAAVDNGAPDASLLKALIAERVAAKRVVVEAMRAGLSTDEPDATLATSSKGEGVPLRDVRPFEDAVDASYEDALRADPAHADLIRAVKAQRDAQAEATYQADVISGVAEADAEEAATPGMR